jgi:hypothetical protein
MGIAPSSCGERPLDVLLKTPVSRVFVLSRGGVKHDLPVKNCQVDLDRIKLVERNLKRVLRQND